MLFSFAAFRSAATKKLVNVPMAFDDVIVTIDPTRQGLRVASAFNGKRASCEERASGVVSSTPPLMPVMVSLLVMVSSSQPVRISGTEEISSLV